MTPTRKDYDATGIVLVIATLIGWSSVPLFLKYLTPYIDAWTANGWRYGIAALLWSPLLAVGLARGTLPKGLWWRALAPALVNTAGQVCFAEAFYHIGAGLSSFLLRVSLIFSTIGAFILFADERVLVRNRLFSVGMTLIVGGSIGTVLLGQEPIKGGTAFGILLGAGAGAFYGLYGVAVRYWMRGIPAMTSFAAISLYTAAGVVTLMFIFAESRGMKALTLSGTNWMVLVTSSLIGIAMGHVFFYAAMARLGVAVTNAVVQLAPFFTGVASIILFKEILTSGQWLSGVTLLCGALILLRVERDRHRSARP